MPVELPVAPIPSEDPKKKKEKAADDENKLGAETNKPGGKPTDEEELASLVTIYPFFELYLRYHLWMHNI
jgi:hypothetical protein